MPSSGPNIVLEAMRVKGIPRLFVLGSFERRVTVYSQQVRAINLVDALVRSKQLDQNAKIAVLGAGVAGLTFSVAAAKYGADVTILEKESEVLPLFRYNPNRWLHPRIYDWPFAGWNGNEAGLPVLNWIAGNVDDVRNQLRDAWDAGHASFPDRLHLIPDATEITPGSYSDQAIWISWNTTNEQLAGTDKFSLVILAVGFGTECESYNGYRTYWEPDDLDVNPNFRPNVDAPVTWLLSGCGDGALTDLLRLCVTDFRHEKIIDLAFLPGVDGARAIIRSIEEDPRSNVPGYESFLFDEYLKLEIPSVIEYFKTRLRKDTIVTLNTIEHYFLQSNSSAFNRFLISQLWRAKAFRLLPGQIKKPVSAENGKFLISFVNRKPQVFDRVVFRHGPRPAIDAFEDFKDALQSLRELWKTSPHLLDQTRERYWIKDTYGPETRSDVELNSVRAPGDGETLNALGELDFEFSKAKLIPFAQRKTIDLRISNWEVRDQGPEGTDVAYALVACREYAIFFNGTNSQEFSLSERSLWWAIKNHTGDKHGLDGTTLKYGLDAISKIGVCTNTFWTQNPELLAGQVANKRDVHILRNAYFNRVQPIYYKSYANSGDVYALLHALGRPVAIALPIFGALHDPISHNWGTASAFNDGSIIDPPPTSVVLGGTAVCVVGFRPNPSRDGGGEFIFRNSWGPQWAAHSEWGAGYGSISASYLDNYTWEIAVI